jgi:exonuclease VII small subunit
MTEEWFVAMGEATSQRKRALSMVSQWQKKVDAAEAKIQNLAEQRQAADTGNVPFEQAQEQEPQ